MTDITQLKELFKDKELLVQALTHKSWVNEHPGVRGTNERLEFLGDAVLEFIVSDHLYREFPDKEEGYLTALRANLVNTQNLAEVAKKLSIGRELLLSKGEEEGGGRENTSILADTVEAIIGAIFIDQGAPAATSFVNENLLEEVSEKVKGPLKDPKSILQELVQAEGFSTPKYKVIEESGPDHNKKFVVEVSIDGKKKGLGEGKSKNLAEQEAAKNALEREGTKKV